MSISIPVGKTMPWTKASRSFALYLVLTMQITRSMALSTGLYGTLNNGYRLLRPHYRRTTCVPWYEALSMRIAAPGALVFTCERSCAKLMPLTYRCVRM